MHREKLWAWRSEIVVVVAAVLCLLAPRLAPPVLAAGLLHLLMRGLPVEGKRASAETLWDGTALLASALVFVIQYQLITQGTGQLFVHELLGGAFDSLASGLLQGSSQIDPASIRWEGLEVAGRTHMYFGPWPALLRMPLHALVPGFEGQWSRLSCYAAAVLTLCAFSRLAAARLGQNRWLRIEDRRFLLLISILGFGLATPLAFMMFSGPIYHEAILWALCGSTWSLHLALSIFDSSDRALPALCALSCAVGVTLLARVTFGAPLYGVLLLAALSRLRPLSRRPSLVQVGRVLLCLLPAVVMLIFQLWYNADRFGSATTLADYHRLEYLVKNRDSWASFQNSGPLNPRRFPTAAANYFGVRAEYFSASFPWIRVARPSYPDRSLYPRMFNSQVVSLSIVSAWIVFSAPIGWLYLLRRRGDWLLKLCGLGLLTEFLLVACFFIMEQRYAVDFFPAFVFGYAFFLREAGLHRPLRGAGLVLARIMLCATLFSSFATLSSTLSAIPVSGPFVSQSYKRVWLDRFRAVDVALAKIIPGGTAEPPQAGVR